jgi:hypothetical protein
VTPRSEPIHRWDRPAVVKALLIGAVVEAVAIAPSLLSPWGHAGPESMPGLLSVLANAPGGALVIFPRTLLGMDAQEPVASLVAEIFLVQTLLIGYVAFVWLRWKKRKIDL